MPGWTLVICGNGTPGPFQNPPHVQDYCLCWGGNRFAKLPGVAKPEFSDAFAAVLRQRREAAGLSQEALAERAGVHPTYIGLVERRQRNPSVNVAESLARALDWPLSKLVREAEAHWPTMGRRR